MQYITPDEIADELRVKVVVVYAWLRKGTLRGLKVGKYWRVRRADYQAFLELMTNVPPDKTTVLPNREDPPPRSSTATARRTRKKKRKRKRKVTQLRDGGRGESGAAAPDGPQPKSS